MKRLAPVLDEDERITHRYELGGEGTMTAMIVIVLLILAVALIAGRRK